MRTRTPEKTRSLTAKDVLPLYKKLSDEPGPYDAYIVLDARKGRIRTATLEPGGGMTSRMVYEFDLLIPVSPYTLKEALEEFLESERVKELVERIKRGWYLQREGMSPRGRLKEDAKEAIEELKRLAAGLPQAVLGDPQEALAGVYRYDERDGLHYVLDRPVTQEGLEELYRRFPEVSTVEGEVHVLPGLHERLEGMARENEERLKGSRVEE